MSDDNSFVVVEWIITNISFWNGEIFQQKLEREGFWKNGGWLFLYSKGTSGHLALRLYLDGLVPNISGDLSFLCPDGSLIGPPQEFSEKESRLEVDPRSGIPRRHRNDKTFVDVFGPRFEGVVQRLRTFPEEQLTLRLRIRHVVGSVHRLHTEHEVYRIALKVSLSAHELFLEKYNVEFPLAGKKVQTEMAVKFGFSEKFEFSLYRPEKVDRFTVHTRLCVLAADGSVSRTELNERVFAPDDNKKWTFSKLPTTVTSVLLHLGVSSGHAVTYSNHSLKGRNLAITPVLLPAAEESPIRVLADDFKNLLLEGSMSDFEIVCGHATFPVHRNVLSARSPVFRSMLSTDMIEAASGRLDVKDLDVPTVSQFLAFLYTGAVEDLECDSAINLYYAADKYQVASLKKECANFLSANVYVSNVCAILLLADRHQDEDLLTHVCKFLSQNYKQVLRSEEWKSLSESDPSLVSKTLTMFLLTDS